MNLPQLWTDNPMASTIAPQQSTTLSGLPSLSQIWGDVGGLDLDFAMGGSTNAAQQQFAFQHGVSAGFSTCVALVLIQFLPADSALPS